MAPGANRAVVAMFVIANLLLAAADVIALLLQLFSIVLLARIVITWVNADPYNPIVRFLAGLTDPLLRQVRRRMPTVYGGIDFAPVVVLLGVSFLQRFLVQSLIDLAGRLR